jgi:hypothetical protein
MLDPLIELLSAVKGQRRLADDAFVTEAESAREADQQNGQRQPDLLILVHG